MVDAGDLNDLSAWLETVNVERFKFGEACKMVIPSQAITETLLKDGHLLQDKL